MRNFFLSAFVFIFNIAFGFALLTFTLRTTFLSPSFYKSVLSQSKFYDQGFYKLTGSLLAESLSSQNMGLPLTNEDIKGILVEAVPSSYLKSETEKVIDEVFAFMSFKKESMDFYLDVKPLKNNAKGAIVGVVEDKLNSLPDCSLEQMKELLNSGGGYIPECKVSGISSIKANLEKEVADGVVNVMPDRVDLLTIGNPKGERPPDFMVKMRVLRENVRVFMILDKIFLAITVVSLFTIFLVAKPMRLRLKWVGWTLVSVSILPLAISAGGIFLGKGALENQLGSSLNSVPAPVVEFVVANVSGIFAGLLQQTLLFSLVAFGVGAVFLLAVLFFHSEKSAIVSQTQIPSQ